MAGDIDHLGSVETLSDLGDATRVDADIADGIETGFWIDHSPCTQHDVVGRHLGSTVPCSPVSP
ncbi:MAG: hypothetical protein WD826_05395 [Actinomycetota bacterium]